MTEFFGDLERRNAEREQHAENTARVAEALARFKSTGLGSIEFEERVDFGLTFTEEPYMSYGTQIDLDDLDDLLGNEAGATTPTLPQCTGFITTWDRDDRGFYVGAWVAVTVWFPYEADMWPDTEIEISHHFTFKAIAMKDVPIEGAED